MVKLIFFVYSDWIALHSVAKCADKKGNNEFKEDEENEKQEQQHTTSSY